MTGTRPWTAGSLIPRERRIAQDAGLESFFAVWPPRDRNDALAANEGVGRSAGLHLLGPGLPLGRHAQGVIPDVRVDLLLLDQPAEKNVGRRPLWLFTLSSGSLPRPGSSRAPS